MRYFYAEKTFCERKDPSSTLNRSGPTRAFFAWWLIFGKFEGSKFLLKKEIGINANIRRIPGTAHLHANFVFIKKWANMLFDHIVLAEAKVKNIGA